MAANTAGEDKARAALGDAYGQFVQDDGSVAKVSFPSRYLQATSHPLMAQTYRVSLALIASAAAEGNVCAVQW